MSEVYLDNNATTEPDPTVVEAVARAMRDLPGNPSSAHRAGRRARAAVEAAREQVGAVLGCSAARVVLTAGATEANNIALIGSWRTARSEGSPRRRIIVGATEHPSVLEAAGSLAAEGALVVLLPVHSDGTPDLAALSSLVDEDTLLVSVMAANNETGVLAPLDRVAEIAHGAGALVHTDLTQAVGRVPVDVYAAGADLASLSAHKFHGPKGVGALFVDTGLRPSPLMLGGGQERGLRPGTLNTPGIVGLGAACMLVDRLLAQSPGVAALRDALVEKIRSGEPDVEVHGAAAPRLSNTASIRIPGVDGEALVLTTPGVAFSTGSACSSAIPRPSHVLTAMGVSDRAASESVRLSLSHTTTRGDVEAAAARILSSARDLRRVRGEGAA